MNFYYEIKQLIDEEDFQKGKNISIHDITENKKALKATKYYSIMM